ncbi:bifunctional 4-hydroxy-2-oxoglutarate aldolase/2-dehydro-3-deoxy-phosphogluconate aldolase [Spirosoma montaniterrae]|uniref:2-dehydro-3-deoxyphosphogluconate aldolase n=1 Tax=Spirosoma montaniterrae TaxID=1178516 RepID=A0A1P9WWW7_9BACT|nr:bifunctional 4-hydroxy-2-oxoglutarate aldolase/2-dehydro-3-deoxy-phosphogluconate aldolase [Spirosoma montaniterrae]AQG79840.1 2-dehydro-3-deoxyphosphogluconate aldolase [Spirosoma montaniterrae]
MPLTTFSSDLFARAPIVGIIRHLRPDEVAAILPVYVESGLTTLEITMNTPGADELIHDALAEYAGRLNIGAGTVRTLADLDSALTAGAQFIVTPTVDEAVIRQCFDRGVPIFPGAFTPTEIQRAWTLGATMVKVYPAGVLGPTYIRDVKAPLDDVKLLPTGGIGLDNVAAFMQAGADGVGMGSQLFDKTLIRAKDWAGLRMHFSAVCQVVTQRFTE